MSEQQPQPRERRLEHDVAWQLYQQWQSDPIDRDHFWAAYLGRYASRADFGRSLLADYGAEARIQSLPSWLRRYVCLDATAFVVDLERSGHFHLADDPAGSGTYVFDAHAREARPLQPCNKERIMSHSKQESSNYGDVPSRSDNAPAAPGTWAQPRQPRRRNRHS